MKKQAYYGQISHNLSQNMLEENEMNYNASCLKYQEEVIKEEVNLKVKKLNKLQLSLDKLSFANTAYRGKFSTTSCLSVDEFNKQKLQFLMQHGGKINMANEKKLLREINSSQKREAGTTLNELDAPILKLNEQIENSHLYLYRADFEAIHREMKQCELVREKAVANAAVGGKLWSSLGSKKDIQERVKAMYEELDELRSKQFEIRNEAKSVEKKLGFIEKQIMFLHKKLERD